MPVDQDHTTRPEPPRELWRPLAVTLFALYGLNLLLLFLLFGQLRSTQHTTEDSRAATLVNRQAAYQSRSLTCETLWRLRPTEPQPALCETPPVRRYWTPPTPRPSPGVR
jgi:hypothetical protein